MLVKIYHLLESDAVEVGKKGELYLRFILFCLGPYIFYNDLRVYLLLNIDWHTRHGKIL